MKNLILIFLVGIIFVSCEKTPTSWQLTDKIETKGINPIGITRTSEGIWLSDGDHKRVVLIDETGAITKAIDSLERPMHIASYNDELLIPLYGDDSVLLWKNDELSQLNLKDSLDAPAGVWRLEKETAIVDFYNHRVLYSGDGEKFISIGQEGKEDGSFYFPTDVQITKNAIWVADAYNNRVQKFDKDGKFLKTIGKEKKMNAATGIYVSETALFVTDFENDRVLIFDLDGNFKQQLKGDISKPIDLMVDNGKLYIINYRNGEVSIFEQKEIVD